jgi:hypothetical protein
MAGLEQQHRARRLFRELGGSVFMQPSPRPMMLVPPDDDQVHSALARQSNDLRRGPAFANFDPGSHLRPEFTVGKLLQPLGAFHVTSTLLAHHIQSVEGTRPFNDVEQDHPRLPPPSASARAHRSAATEDSEKSMGTRTSFCFAAGDWLEATATVAAAADE